MKRPQGKGKEKQQQQQQQQGKKKEAAAGGDDEEAGSVAGSDDGNAPDDPKKQKEKGKQAKKKEGKEPKAGKDNTERPSSPPLFPSTPFYGHPYPDASKQRPVLEQPGWGLEQSIATARRADENYIEQWMTEKGAPFQAGAMKWLEDRERKRRAQIEAGGPAYPFPTMGGAGKQVAFAAPSDSGRPLFQPQLGYDSNLFMHGSLTTTEDSGLCRPLSSNRANLLSSIKTKVTDCAFPTEGK